MGLVVLGISIVGSELDNVFRAILPPPDWLNDIFLRLAGHDTSLWGSILALVIVAPMTEELLFRGLFLRGFLSRYTPHKAVLVSGILFGLFHLNPWQFVHTTVIGILLGWWFFKTRSLIPCLFGHALNNSLLFIYRDILNLHISGYTTGMGQGVQFQPLWLDAAGLMLLICGIWLLMQLLRRAGESPSQNQSSENAETCST
jgi:membrane protease YdiL (CAAX protease family)